MMTIFSVTEWQYKSLSYYYGFQGVGDKFGDPKYEMSSDFTQMHDFYGLMSGIVYDLPYGVLVLAFAGLSKSKQRVPITAWFMILQSLTYVVTGVTRSFPMVLAMRFFHSVFSSIQEPLCYSIIADYYRDEKRASANSILTASNYFGIAFSSLTIILIQKFGWRMSHVQIGLAGVLGGLLVQLIMREPLKYRL